MNAAPQLDSHGATLYTTRVPEKWSKIVQGNDTLSTSVNIKTTQLNQIETIKNEPQKQDHLNIIPKQDILSMGYKRTSSVSEEIVKSYQQQLIEITKHSIEKDLIINELKSSLDMKQDIIIALEKVKLDLYFKKDVKLLLNTLNRIKNGTQCHVKADHYESIVDDNKYDEKKDELDFNKSNEWPTVNENIKKKKTNLVGNVKEPLNYEGYETDILNIGQFLEMDEFHISDVAVAAEPTVIEYVESNSKQNQLDTSKESQNSIWDLWKEENLKCKGIQQEGSKETGYGLSMYPTLLYGPTPTSSQVNSTIWKNEFIQSKQSVHQSQSETSDSPINDTTPIAQESNYYNQTTILEEYEQEANKLRYLSFEKNTKQHLQCLVDKIVRTNDQPASLLLQQKIKTSSETARSLIYECVMENCLSLMRNRFGNFLMQRCIECGSPTQIQAIANVMKGNMYNLSCDRFGCHVVQKMIELVDDYSKYSLLSEFLPFIHETIGHRFACHVWQRIFEIKWQTQDPLNLISFVTSSLKSSWQRIANDENGSLVVQCIFENCSEEDKAPILNEVMMGVLDISKGQWGNWVIQHILEHGSLHDREFLYGIVLQNIYPMSIDQYASKIVEKALKTAPKRELSEMINRVIIVQSHENLRPYILDMMSNQYANYVVQHILSVCELKQRDICLQLMISHVNELRGSKYGQRVAQIIERLSRINSPKLWTSNEQQKI